MTNVDTPRDRVLSILSPQVDTTGAHVKKSQIKPGMPFADSAIAKYIDKKIDELKGVKTQREIAQEAGYEMANIISMFKRGESRVPLDKIPLLSKALGVDPAHMFRLALEQYWPDRGDIIAKLFGRLASENEEEILLKPWRTATRNADPETSVKIEVAVTKMIESLWGKQD
jgi:transcriptional regulator with XRE-family HTH domain